MQKQQVPPDIRAALKKHLGHSRIVADVLVPRYTFTQVLTLIQKNKVSVNGEIITDPYALISLTDEVIVK